MSGRRAKLRTFAAAAAALAVCACARGPGGPCASDDDCQRDLRCELGLPDGYCTADCPDGSCPDRSECRDLSGMAICLRSCDRDGDCRDGYRCNAGVCDLPCASDADCPAARRCNVGFGSCVRGLAPCGLVPLADACPCREGADCASGDCALLALGPTCVPVDPPLGNTIELGALATTDPDGTGPVTFDLPAGSVAFTLVAESLEGALCLMPRLLVDPQGTVWYDHDTWWTAYLSPWPGFPVLTMLVPDNDFSGPPPAGTWTVVVDTYDCDGANSPFADPAMFSAVAFGGVSPVLGTIDRLAVLPKAAPGGVMHLNLHFTPGTGITALAAPSNEFVAGFTARFWEVYGDEIEGAGYGLGVTTFYGAPAAYDTIDDDATHYGACAALAEPAPDGGPAINIVIVAGFDGDLAGILGTAAGIPGAMVHDHVFQACVLVEVYPLSNDTMGTITAHEVGHHLGLRHTTEVGGGFTDAISDTPECPNFDVVNPQGCPDFENIMFPYSNPDNAARGVFSPGQVLVLSGMPALR